MILCVLRISSLQKKKLLTNLKNSALFIHSKNAAFDNENTNVNRWLKKSRVRIYIEGLSSLALLAFGTGLFFAVGTCPIHCRMISNILGLHSLNASGAISSSLNWQPKMSSDTAKCPQEKQVHNLPSLTDWEQQLYMKVSRTWLWNTQRHLTYPPDVNCPETLSSRKREQHDTSVICIF